jgi:hypothetical protein
MPLLDVPLDVVHLADLPPLVGVAELLEPDDRLRGGDAGAVQRAVRGVHVAVAVLDVPLVGRVALLERVAGAPLVGHQAAEQEHALAAARRRVEAGERAEPHGFGARRRADVLGIDDVRILDVEDVVRRAGRGERDRRRGEQDGRASTQQPLELISVHWSSDLDA